MTASATDPPRDDAAPARRPAWLRAPRSPRVPIAALLVSGFGGLVLLAVASVLALGLWGAGSNTFSLLVGQADMTVDAVERRVRGQLDPARAQAAFVADELASGRLSFEEPDRLVDTLRGVLAATPHVTAIVAVAPDLRNARAARIDGAVVGARDPLEGRDLQAAAAGLADARDRPRPYWAEPVWAEGLQSSLISLRHPVRDGDRFLGLVAVAVSLGELSRFLTELFVEEGQSGALLLGRTHVIAHPSLAGRGFRFQPAEGGPALPEVERIGDPLLSAVVAQPPRPHEIIGDMAGRSVRAAGAEHLVLERPLAGYGPEPWTLVVAQPIEAVSAATDQLWRMAVAGLGILAASVAAAYLIARRLSARIARFAGAAEAVRTLDFRSAPPLPRSRVRELDDSARAFNAMVAALGRFETYVPKGLVLDLMRRGGGVRSQLRPLTIMFSDIRGFTELSDRMGPEQVAELLNRHFALVCACIEAEGGSVDKFIGDAVMAFWNAPADQPDHAARALRAARAIGAALAADNARRAEEGLPPVRVSVGLHTGPVVVGDIGPPSRMNYTIVGGAVNVASRLEAAAAERQGDAQVMIVASADTVASARAEAEGAVEIGPLFLRGVGEPVSAWRVPAG